MKVILIEDKDAKSLLEKLEFAKLKEAGFFNYEKPGEPLTSEQIHRVFHLVVTRWLQEQGADRLFLQ